MRKAITILLLLLLVRVSFAQDPQFSQYYAAPLILNPALAGETDCYRAGMNARNQWTGLPGGSFNTASFFVDLNYPDLRSGFGLMALYDVIGTPRMSSTEISGFYSYLAPVSKMINLRFGLQGTFVSRGMDYSRLYFEDQFSGIVLTNPATMDEVSKHANINYFDAAAGVMLFGEDKYWLGFSAHHLTQPDQGLYMSSYLPRKFSLHGGWNFYTKQKGRNQEQTRIIPTFMYKTQDKYDQLDLGIYFMSNPFLFGAWYRGIPVKRDFKVYNNDAINLQVGYKFRDFTVTYSYDFTISRLNIRNTWGSHEISLVYLFCLDWPQRKKPPRSSRRLPCPDFQRSLKYKGNF